MDVFLITIENMAVYLAFFVAGIFFTAKKLLPESSGRTLSFLITNLFTPAICFNTFAQKFTAEKVGGYAFMLGAGLVYMLVFMLLALPAKKLMPGNRYDKLTVQYSMVVPNYGNLGYPLILVLFGQEILSKYMMFGLLFNFFAFGYIMPQYMTDSERPGMLEKLKKSFSLPLIMILIGIVYGLSGLQYPHVLDTFCSASSNCLAPVSFMVLGIAVGRKPLLSSLRDGRAWVLSAIRLVILPLITIFGVFFLCRSRILPAEVLLVVGLYSAMPLGSNPVIFAEAYGGDGSLAASGALISTVMVVITLPLVRVLLEYLMTLL